VRRNVRKFLFRQLYSGQRLSGWEDKFIPQKKDNEPLEHEIKNNLAEAGSVFSTYRNRWKEQS